MAKKKKKHGEKDQKQSPPKSDFPWQMNSELLSGWDPNSPANKARELLQQALDDQDEARRVELAHEALAIDPDCTDAYNMLAENAPTRKQSLALFEQAVASGERSLGPEAFQRDVGQFWGLPNTRPYMLARLGLAHSLWSAGRRDEAVQHLYDLLRLNPNDNQGIRYTLAGFLLFLDRDQDLNQLLERYPDENSATWMYTRALLSFRQQGDTAVSRQLMAAARKTNIHVPAYIIGEKTPPESLPDYYVPGEQSEALQYIGSFLVGWKSTLGAVAWLREIVKGKKAGDDEPPAKGPLRVIKKWLRDRLEQSTDVWQAECRQMRQWIMVNGVRVRMWVVLVATRSQGLVLSYHISEEKPTAAHLWDALAQAMQNPMAKEPHRPTEIHVIADELWESLRPHLQELEVELCTEESLDLLDVMFKEVGEQVCGKATPGLLDMPGVTPEQVGSLYESAAAFFSKAPWKKLGYESTIKIECRQFESGPWYAVLMGQSGLMQGLTLYENLKLLKRMWAGAYDQEENARRSVALTLLYGEESDTPPADVDAANEYGWKVARPDAYPTIFHKDRGMTIRPALAWELELMEGCLRAIPGFIDRHPQDEPARETLLVPTATRELQMELSWVVADE
jgi:tetratricopeptide (TPR) repeat protein